MTSSVKKIDYWIHIWIYLVKTLLKVGLGDRLLGRHGKHRAVLFKPSWITVISSFRSSSSMVYEWKSQCILKCKAYKLISFDSILSFLRTSLRNSFARLVQQLDGCKVIYCRWVDLPYWWRSNDLPFLVSNAPWPFLSLGKIYAWIWLNCIH